MRRVLTPRTRVVTGLAGVTALLLAATGSGAAGRNSGPAYGNFRPATEVALEAAEPSIGVNHKTNAVLFQAGTETLRVTFDDAKRRSTWTDVTADLEGRVTLDPILYTDPVTGRTFVSQLLLACSLMSFTDDDGETWVPTQGCGPGSAFDHQTVASGPYADTAGPSPASPLYPHAVYYCAQKIAAASCARSDNGGLTFGPGVPMYTWSQCDGLHGHMRIAPDGTLYVPHFSCNGKHAVVVSEDNGVTWAVRPVPGSTVNGESDDSVSVGADGTVYFGYQDGEGSGDTHPMIAVSKDKGRTWQHITDVGRSHGIRNIQFPAVIAGDGDRAAYAFLGTKTGGNDQTDEFRGIWHLYIATTYDGGRTWKTVDATPKEIVQRGCIRLTGCAGRHRNLLDFNDIAIDKYGRVLVAWADGCVGECEAKNGEKTFEDLGVITRQISGRTLFKKFDRMFAK